MGIIQDVFDDSLSEDTSTDDNSSSDTVESGITRGATHYHLTLNWPLVTVSWKSWTESGRLRLADNLVTCMASWYHDDFATTEVFCCTEYKCNDVNVWSHPSYHGECPWFDWVLVHFDTGTVDNVTFPNPCKVMSIVPSDCNIFLDETQNWLFSVPVSKLARTLSYSLNEN